MKQFTEVQLNFAIQNYPNEYKEWQQLTEQFATIEKELEEDPRDEDLAKRHYKVKMALILLEIILYFRMPDKKDNDFKTLCNLIHYPK
jgi:hypothetical protein